MQHTMSVMKRGAVSNKLIMHPMHHDDALQATERQESRFKLHPSLPTFKLRSHPWRSQSVRKNEWKRETQCEKEVKNQSSERDRASGRMSQRENRASEKRKEESV